MKATLWLALSLMIFSLWVAFALLVVNPYLHPYVPGYQVGRPCGWEFVAAGISGGLGWLFVRRWPAPALNRTDQGKTVALSFGFVVFCIAYGLVALGIFAWRYYIFSNGFAN
ncbi:MAG: hypothetical protein IH888_01390 [Planctomycetes bacterium]|nr:hypothetical protein [Planctomycetota bacterium]